MKKLLNLQNKKQNLKLRRQLIKLAATAPDKLRDFCTMFYKFDKQMLNNFKHEIDINDELKNFLTSNEKIWRYILLETNFDYKNFFNPDKEYEKIAQQLFENTGYYVLELLYIVINFIDDNFPITIKREFTQKEKILIKNLMFNGEEIEETEAKVIFENLNCQDINTAINLILTAKHLKEENIEFLNRTKMGLY